MNIELKNEANDLIKQLAHPVALMLRRLLKEIEQFEKFNDNWQEKYSQQANRIAELEKKVCPIEPRYDCNRIGRCGYTGEKLTLQTNAEPVAWRKSEIDGEGQYFAYREEEPKWLEGYIPLYTTPQTKPLSDEEIENLWYDPRFIGDPVAFGKAILRTLENKPLQTDEEICNKCDALTEKALSKKSNRRKAWD